MPLFLEQKWAHYLRNIAKLVFTVKLCNHMPSSAFQALFIVMKLHRAWSLVRCSFGSR